MSELRVDNIVSQDGSAAPVYTKGIIIGAGQSITNQGDFIVEGSSTLQGSVNITNTGITTVAGTLDVTSTGISTFTGNIWVGGAGTVTGSLDVLGGGTLNTAGIITAANIDVTTNISYDNLAIGGWAEISDRLAVGVGTTYSDSIANILDDLLVTTGVAATRDIRIRAYDDELGSLSFENVSDGTQYFSISADSSTTQFAVNSSSSFLPRFEVYTDGSANIHIRTLSEKIDRVDGNTVTIAYGTNSNIGFCTNPSGDITVNVNNIPTDDDYDNSHFKFKVIVLQGGTARTITAVNFNSVSAPIHWVGGQSYSGNINSYDVFNIVGLNTVGAASTTDNLIALISSDYD